LEREGYDEGREGKDMTCVFQRRERRGDEMKDASEGEGRYCLHIFPQRKRRGGWKGGHFGGRTGMTEAGCGDFSSGRGGGGWVYIES